MTETATGGHGAAPGRAVSASDFEMLMTAVGPFESAPVIAVAVSGGRDSLALCLLTDVWARARGGRAVALVVDHGLRGGSAREAATVGEWLTERRIENRLLIWSGEKPRSRIQEAARRARYQLLQEWCRRHGVLHLALAHHREDQAETFLLRLSRGSGATGLSGMSAIVETGGVRLIRPLLRVAGADLGQTLRQFGQEWIEDPSNRNRIYARVRAREWLAALETAGVGPSRLAATATGYGEERIAAEAGAARLLASSCRISPAGYAVIETEKLTGVPADMFLYILGQLARTIGGGEYRPGIEKLKSLFDWLVCPQFGKSRTLAGCRFIQTSAKTLLVCRENRRLPAPRIFSLGEVCRWDKRFRIEARVSGPPLVKKGKKAELHLVPLGREGWRDIVEKEPSIRHSPHPFPARLTLPAISDTAGIREVPLLGYLREGVEPETALVLRADFRPANALTDVGFCLARDVSSTIS